MSQGDWKPKDPRQPPDVSTPEQRDHERFDLTKASFAEVATKIERELLTFKRDHQLPENSSIYETAPSLDGMTKSELGLADNEYRTSVLRADLNADLQAELRAAIKMRAQQHTQPPI